MLVLSRKCGEKIIIDDNVTITVIAVKGSVVRIAVQAPDNVLILRSELVLSQDEIDEPEVEVQPLFFRAANGRSPVREDCTAEHDILALGE
jgi:carbon storage regulator CsrA